MTGGTPGSKDCRAAPRSERGREGGGGEALRDFGQLDWSAAQQGNGLGGLLRHPCRCRCDRCRAAKFRRRAQGCVSNCKGGEGGRRFHGVGFGRQGRLVPAEKTNQSQFDQMVSKREASGRKPFVVSRSCCCGRDVQDLSCSKSEYCPIFSQCAGNGGELSMTDEAMIDLPLRWALPMPSRSAVATARI